MIRILPYVEDQEFQFTIPEGAKGIADIDAPCLKGCLCGGEFMYESLPSKELQVMQCELKSIFLPKIDTKDEDEGGIPVEFRPCKILAEETFLDVGHLLNWRMKITKKIVVSF